ncbi:hypothetical protein RHMOL_Rhmol01G0145000 [Rhododendron molle]|uniref:Uncharacterized protein n=1 Tax=Rhododendron molle TaxID=49168 RepID=A0ACC0Q2U4_RHOML|nr:hypothetical protein RHMOL_Rhmol01G0145000 [Rhododendron molle]
MVMMTSLCSGIHTISTNRKEGNVHPLLKRVNKIALLNKCYFYRLKKKGRIIFNTIIVFLSFYFFP